MRRAVERFERSSPDRDFFFGEFGLADVIAFPFLKYPVLGWHPATTIPSTPSRRPSPQLA